MKFSQPDSGGDFFRAGLIAFALAGILDWSLAMASASAVGFGGAALGLIVFLSQWILGGAIWSLLFSGALWIATGRLSTTPFLRKWAAKLGQIWRERRDEDDKKRLATLLGAGAGLALFIGGSLSLTSDLIATRNGPSLIALTSLLGQLLLAALAFFVALGFRRLFRFLLRRRPAFFHTPFVLGLIGLGALVGLIAAILAQKELFFAVEGPSFLLFAGALLLQPLMAYGLRARRLPRLLRLGLWGLPLLFLLVGSFAAQNQGARRLVVINGNTARFSFHLTQTYLPTERLFARNQCDPFAEDISACLDPKWERPFARAEVPPFERPELNEAPSFLVITWDSVRADRLTFMGHYRDTTPNLAEFAKKSLVFDRAFSADSGTGPSLWSLMTGKTPFQVQLHDAHRFPPRLDDSEKLLAELLQASGYKTRAIVCADVFLRPNWKSMWRGLEGFEEVCGTEKKGLAPRTTAAALKAFEELASKEEPFFLWVHYYDPHHPYEKYPEIDFGDELVDRYDEELRYTDEHMQPLLEAAVSADRPLYTIFSADHGENFNEHGRDPHARNLYRIVTQVPKIIYGPGISPDRIDAPVALNDLYPTILDLAGLEIPPETSMVSQVPVLFGAPADQDRMVFQENSYSRPRRHTKAVVYQSFHYLIDLTSRTEELYDYVADPLERKNLIGAGLREEAILRQAMLRFLETTEIPEGLKD